MRRHRLKSTLNRLLVALTIAVTFAFVLQWQAVAFSGCSLAFTSLDGLYFYANPVAIYGVDEADQGAWVYIEWGDGTSNYTEVKYETGDVYFNPSHTFPDDGPYYGYVAIGTLGSWAPCSEWYATF
jgi:hypothetical protein